MLEYLRLTRGFDFTSYKRPSLRRRIEKRMGTVGVETMPRYRGYLDANDGEVHALFDTILINVTGFFRDPQAWEYVSAEVIPSVVGARAPDEPIRVWSAGCATGEEAYTASILLAEALGADGYRQRVKIYATDVDLDALGRGRRAVYDERAVEQVPAELRERYFERIDDGFQVVPELRRNVIFGRQDLLRDPPISRVDLLVARNTLMYFRGDAQTRILTNFHFSLHDDGFLFLGKSEVLLTRSRLFVPVELKRRVFAKAAPSADAAPPRAHLERTVAVDATSERLHVAGFDSSPSAQLVIDDRGHLVLANKHARSLFGIAGRDLNRPLQDFELSYRPLDLRSHLDALEEQAYPRTVRDVEWPVGGETRYFDVQLAPLHARDGTAIGVSMSFVDITRFRTLQDAVEQANEQLETANEELQSTAEELETTNEELQSTNEELETTNEELQSTNEELETMNEELQSTNEELETINDELRLRTDELNGLNALLESILGSLQSGVVAIDAELRVDAWNDHSTELWGLRADEVVGQHLLNLDTGLPLTPIVPLLRAALAGESEDGQVVVNATNRRGRAIRCTVTCSPLRDLSGAVRGAILVMDAAPADGG